MSDVDAILAGEDPEEVLTEVKRDRGRWLGLDVSFKPPTKNHRLAIWEMMLGTVYAMNEARKIKYFDYDYEAAIEYSGARTKKDLRRSRVTSALRFRLGQNRALPSVGKMVLWVERDTAAPDKEPSRDDDL